MSLFDRVFRRRRLYDELAEEVQAHLDEKADELVARGLSRADAVAAARRAFGNVTRVEEAGHETWQWPTLESFAMDVRYALRQLRRTPALAAIVLFTLGIGIAATTTVFSWTRAILLDPLPGAGAPHGLQALEYATASGTWTPTSWPDYLDLRRYLRSFEGLAAAFPVSLTVGDATHGERRLGELVSANFFDVLRVRPALGRFFPPQREDAPGAEPAAVVSYALWRSRWHGDSSVIGRVVHVDRFPFTVIGVAPPAFHGSMPGEDVAVWVPAAMVRQILPTGGSMLGDRAWRTFRVFARLAPGVALAAARDELTRVSTTMARINGGRSTGMSARLMPIWKSHWGMQDSLRSPLLVLIGACALVLLIACANTASLLLARATARRRELGLRIALGAPRLRLVRQLLTEASLLAAGGTALGLLATLWLSRSLHWLVPSYEAASLVPPPVDASVLAFTAVLACGVTLLAGVAPALHGAREHPGTALAEGGRGAVGGRQAARLRAGFVIAEISLAVTSLACAGLFYQSFRHTRALSPGFRADPVAMGAVSLTLAGYDSAAADAFLTHVVDRLTAAPGVTAASYSDYVPLSLEQGSWEDLVVEGYAPEPNENMKLFRSAVGPGYFEVMGIPLVAGREFRADDDSAHAAVMIVNETFVRRYLHGGPALGVRVRGWGRWFTIVGVAKDAKYYRLTEPPTPYFYVPVRQVYRPEYGYAFLARGDAPPDVTVQAIVRAVRAEDPTVSVYEAMPLLDYIGAPLRAQQTAVRLLALLAAVALLLASIGLYGVIAFNVAQRTREIGVRIALGARPASVLRFVASQAGSLLAAGLVAGLAGAIALGRIVSSLLYGVGAADLTVLTAASAGTILVALLATSIPAMRAMRVDPVIALRAE